MDYDVKYIAENIKKLKENQGLSLFKLASGSGVSYDTIVDIYHGRTTNPSVKTLIKIAMFLQFPIQKFLEKA